MITFLKLYFFLFLWTTFVLVFYCIFSLQIYPVFIGLLIYNLCFYLSVYLTIYLFIYISIYLSRYKFGEANPFHDPEEEGEVCSVGYRYRKWSLGNDLVLVCRCEIDAVQTVSFKLFIKY